MIDVRTWFVANYRHPIAQPSEGLFPDPRFGCKTQGVAVPATVAESEKWWWERLSDFGGAWSLQYDVGGETCFMVFVGTDGDDGAVELFDASGAPLDCAFLDGRTIQWASIEDVRARFPEPEP